MPTVPDVLALCLTPRKKGNSELLLESFLKGIKEKGAGVEIIYPRDLNISACTECGSCDDSGECNIIDDMQDLYPLLIETKRIVVASPIFFYGVPSDGKALIDRCQTLWNRNKLFPDLKRPDGKGFFLGVGATKGANLFEGTILCIKYFLDAIGLPFKLESLTYRQVEKKGAINDHPTALKEAYQAGLNFPRE